MINKLVNHKNAVRNTALSFAVMGTFMHGLNIAHATNSTLSQAWSVVAILGFFLTVTSFVNKRPLFETSKIRKWHNRRPQNGTSHIFARDEVALP
jgi:hypothetical protein